MAHDMRETHVRPVSQARDEARRRDGGEAENEGGRRTKRPESAPRLKFGVFTCLLGRGGGFS